MDAVNATGLFILKWLILCAVNFICLVTSGRCRCRYSGFCLMCNLGHSLLMVFTYYTFGLPDILKIFSSFIICLFMCRIAFSFLLHLSYRHTYWLLFLKESKRKMLKRFCEVTVDLDIKVFSSSHFVFDPNSHCLVISNFRSQ